MLGDYVKLYDNISCPIIIVDGNDNSIVIQLFVIRLVMMKNK